MDSRYTWQAELTGIDDRLDMENVKNDSWFLACIAREMVGSLDEKLGKATFVGDES